MSGQEVQQSQHFVIDLIDQSTNLAGPRRDIALIFLSAFALYLTTAVTADLMFFGLASIQVYSLLGALDGLRLRKSGMV